MPGKSVKYTSKKGGIDQIEQSGGTEKFSENGAIFQTYWLVTCVKCLLVPTYHSTDFEVHRNWLAITHSLPINEWYVNARSQWTLDYPPFFAWFEYLLSHFAVFADPEMLKVDNLDHASYSTVLYQRATVMFSDLVLAYGVKKLGKVFCQTSSGFIIFTFLTLCNIGLLVIDHIHFQYNGFLLGIFFISIAEVCQSYRQSGILGGAVLFAVLLNLKHIYLYVVPAYVVWLLKWYCLRDNHFFRRFSALGCTVFCVLAVSFGPFVTQLPQTTVAAHTSTSFRCYRKFVEKCGQTLMQYFRQSLLHTSATLAVRKVISRLFPFKRGLVHAYWAANSWALYTGADKILSIIWKRLGWLSHTRIASMTGGLVQEDSFAILPTPTPLATFVLTFISMLPALWSLLRRNQTTLIPRDFVRCIIICGLSSFMFGWHVHEKAILTAIIPLCVLATTDPKDARVFLILSSAGHTAILPLLYPTNLSLLKIILSVTYMCLASLALTLHFKKSLLLTLEWIYVGSLPLMTLYESILHKFIFDEKLPFLPLALTSLYCALGVTYSWLIYYRIFIKRSDQKDAKVGDHAQ